LERGSRLHPGGKHVNRHDRSNGAGEDDRGAAGKWPFSFFYVEGDKKLYFYVTGMARWIEMTNINLYGTISRSIRFGNKSIIDQRFNGVIALAALMHPPINDTHIQLLQIFRFWETI
jgi:hypothetical protein